MYKDIIFSFELKKKKSFFNILLLKHLLFVIKALINLGLKINRILIIKLPKFFPK